MTEEHAFLDLFEKVITEIENLDNEELLFHIEGGYTYRMYHSQECCESVYIESITGELDDLIGSPILRAAEEVSVAKLGQEEIKALDLNHDTMLWTFYKLATIKGYVDIRWFGCSNGYYSVGVEFELIDKKEE